MALKHAFGEAGQTIWLDWSKKSDKYDEENALYNWDSFKDEANGVTLGTLYFLAGQGGWKQASATKDAEDYIERKEHPFVWDAPLGFDEITTPDIPASLLPGVCGEFANALSLAAETPQALATMNVLGTLSVACNKRFVVSPCSGWSEPTNLYIATALEPGNNKSFSVRNCSQPIDDWELGVRQAMEPAIRLARSTRKNEESQVLSLRAKAAKCPDVAKREAMFAEVARIEGQLTEIPIAPKIYLNDVTPETLTTAICEQNGRIAVISDEGGIMETMAGLYSKGQANYDILLKGIDGGRVRLQRKDREVDVNPHLTIVLIVQPKVIRNMSCQKAFQGRGLLERFLYALPRSNLGYRTLSQAPIPAALRDRFNHCIRSLLDLPPLIEHGYELPRVLTLTDDAGKLWQRFRHEVEEALRPDGKLNSCLGWGGKLVGFTLRIAGLLHVAEHGHSIHSIDSSTMERAITMARLLIEHALATFGLMREDESGDDAKVIYGWIIQQGEPRFWRTDCLKKFHGRFTTKKRMDAAVAVLIDHNIISPLRQEVTTKDKRAKLFYEVNPLIFDRK
jgi:hypothetical protein